MTYSSTLTSIRVAVPAIERARVVDYDAHSLQEYASKWDLRMNSSDLEARASRTVGDDGAINIWSAPSRPGVGANVNELALSSEWFPVPNRGSLEFSTEMRSTAPKAEGAHLNASDSDAPPTRGGFADPTCGDQQPTLIFSMSNVETQQSFRWFVSGDSVLAMIQRVPKNIAQFTLPATDPAYIGRERATSEIIKTALVTPGESHNYAIRYSREDMRTFVEYLIDGDLFACVGHHEKWLDSVGSEFTGASPGYRQSRGKEFRDRADTFVIGHGLFSTTDSIQHRHPDAPEFGVSVPITQRRFGAGGEGTFSNFKVTTITA